MWKLLASGAKSLAAGPNQLGVPGTAVVLGAALWAASAAIIVEQVMAAANRVNPQVPLG